MAAYTFTGPNPAVYHFGEAKPGDIAYFAGRAPDGNWTEVAAVSPPTAPAAEAEADAPRRPNKAAPAEEWKAFAAADGSFQDATGKHPDDATRREIVDHYSDGTDQ